MPTAFSIPRAGNPGNWAELGAFHLSVRPIRFKFVNVTGRNASRPSWRVEVCGEVRGKGPGLACRHFLAPLPRNEAVVNPVPVVVLPSTPSHTAGLSIVLAGPHVPVQPKPKPILM